MYQWVGAMQPGATYIFSAYVKVLQKVAQSSIDGGRLFVNLNGVTIDSGYEYLTRSSAAWYQVKYTFTAPTDASTAARSSLTIGVTGDSTTVTVKLAIDDISITPA